VFYPDGFNLAFRLRTGPGSSFASVPSNLPKREPQAVQVSVETLRRPICRTRGNEAFGLHVLSSENILAAGLEPTSLIENMDLALVRYGLRHKPATSVTCRPCGKAWITFSVEMRWGISYVTATGNNLCAAAIYPTCLLPSIDPSYPAVPKGALAGGPNSSRLR